MAESNLAVELRQQLKAKAELWNQCDALSQGADGKRDMSRKELLEKLGAVDASDAKGKIDALYYQIEELNTNIDKVDYEYRKNAVKSIGEGLDRPIRPETPNARAFNNEPRTFGQLAVDSKGFMDGVRAKQNTKTEIDYDLKTLLQTSAGLQPRTGNGDRIVDKVIRPVQLLDMIPTDTTELFEIPFMEETTRTQAAAEIAEAGTYQEDAFAFTRRTSAVRKIGSQIPATDEQLADVGIMRSLLDNRLRFGLLAQLDKQILVGSGVSPALQGIVGSLTGGGSDVSNLQSQARGADAAANAFFKAMTLVRITGRATPDMFVMHGTDWQNIRLAQNAQGDYQFGPPSAVGADTLWGLPVVQSEALTQGTAVVGAFSTYSQLYYRKGVEVAVGYISTQFIEGKVTLRADLRAAYVIYRGAAFCKVTGL